MAHHHPDTVDLCEQSIGLEVTSGEYLERRSHRTGIMGVRTGRAMAREMLEHRRDPSTLPGPNVCGAIVGDHLGIGAEGPLAHGVGARERCHVDHRREHHRDADVGNGGRVRREQILGLGDAPRLSDLTGRRNGRDPPQALHRAALFVDCEVHSDARARL